MYLKKYFARKVIEIMRLFYFLEHQIAFILLFFLQCFQFLAYLKHLLFRGFSFHLLNHFLLFDFYFLFHQLLPGFNEDFIDPCFLLDLLLYLNRLLLIHFHLEKMHKLVFVRLVLIVLFETRTLWLIAVLNLVFLLSILLICHIWSSLCILLVDSAYLPFSSFLFIIIEEKPLGQIWSPTHNNHLINDF